jgi:hypothetical protein
MLIETLESKAFIGCIEMFLQNNELCWWDSNQNRTHREDRPHRGPIENREVHITTCLVLCFRLCPVSVVHVCVGVSKGNAEFICRLYLPCAVHTRTLAQA